MSKAVEILDRPKGTVVISPAAKPACPEDYIKLRFGLSLPELVKDIRENKNGRYDCLFVSE